VQPADFHVPRVNDNELEIDYNYGDLYLWQGQPFTGIAYDLHPDGSLWGEVEYVDGREHGKAREWYPSGQLKAETTYLKGAYFGPDREWDENEQLRSETIYEYSYPIRERKWNEAGQLVLETRLGPESPKYSRLQALRETYDQHLTINKEEWLNQ